MKVLLAKLRIARIYAKVYALRIPVVGTYLAVRWGAIGLMGAYVSSGTERGMPLIAAIALNDARKYLASARVE